MEVSSAKRKQLPALEQLPVPSAIEKAEIWLDDDELKAFRRTRRVRPEHALIPMLVFVPLIWFELCFGLHAFVAWRLMVTGIIMWYFSCMIIPLVSGYRAFSRLEAGDPGGALKICDRSTSIMRYLGPIGSFYQS